MPAGMRVIQPSVEEIYRVRRLIHEIAKPFHSAMVDVYARSLPTLFIRRGSELSPLIQTVYPKETEQHVRLYEAMMRSAILSGVPPWAAEYLRAQWHDKLIEDDEIAISAAASRSPMPVAE